MQTDRFTIKAQEALQAAQGVAQRFSHQEIDSVPIQAELDTGGDRAVVDGSLGTWYGGRI